MSGERPESVTGEDADNDVASAEQRALEEQYDLTNLTESSFMFEQFDMVYKPPDKVLMESYTAAEEDKSSSDGSDAENKGDQEENAAPSEAASSDVSEMDTEPVSPIKPAAKEDLNGTVLASQQEINSPPATKPAQPSRGPPLSPRQKNNAIPASAQGTPVTRSQERTLPDPKPKGVKFSSDCHYATFQTSGPANKLHRSQTPVRAKTASTHKVVRDPTPLRKPEASDPTFQAPRRRQPMALDHQPVVGFHALPTPPRRVAFAHPTPTRPLAPGPRKDTPHPLAPKSRSLILKPSRKQLESEGIQLLPMSNNDEEISPPPPSILQQRNPKRRDQASQVGPASGSQNEAETVSRLRSLLQGVKEKHGSPAKAGLGSEEMILDSPVNSPSPPANGPPASLFSIPECASVGQDRPLSSAKTDLSGVSKIRDVKSFATAKAKICSDMSRLDRHLKATKNIGVQTVSLPGPLSKRRASVGYLPESPIAEIRARSRQRRSQSLNIPQFNAEFIAEPVVNEAEEMDMNKALDSINTKLKSPFDRWKKSKSAGIETPTNPVPINLGATAEESEATLSPPRADPPSSTTCVRGTPVPGGGIAPSTGPRDHRRRSGTKRPRLTRDDESRPKDKRLRLSAPPKPQRRPSSAPPQAVEDDIAQSRSVQFGQAGTPDNPGDDASSVCTASTILKDEPAETFFQNPNTNYVPFASFN